MSVKDNIKMLNSAKGVAKRIYDIADIRPGMLGRGGVPIGAGIYWPTPEPMLDAAIKYLQEVKAKKGRLSSPGSIWTPTGRKTEENKYLNLIADKLQKENKIDVNPETDILITAGVSPAIFMIPMLMVNPGEEILIIQPDYVRQRNAKVWGAKLVDVPLQERQGITDETRWYFDPAELEKRVTEKSKLISFCSPNNPTGYVYSKDDLNAIANIAKKHDLFVFCNECYERFVWTEKFYKTLVFDSIAAIQGMQERTFTTQGATKGYDVEGSALIGWIVAPAEYVKILQWLQFVCNQKSGSPVDGYMGMASLTSPLREDYIRQQWKVYTEERELLWGMLNKFSWIECGKPKGGPFVFPDISKSGMDEESFTQFCAERGASPSSGTAWGPEYGKGHVRFSYCSPIEFEKVMITRLEEVLTEYEIFHKDRLKK